MATPEEITPNDSAVVEAARAALRARALLQELLDESKPKVSRYQGPIATSNFTGDFTASIRLSFEPLKCGLTAAINCSPGKAPVYHLRLTAHTKKLSAVTRGLETVAVPEPAHHYGSEERFVRHFKRAVARFHKQYEKEYK